jgi:(p)ppGpp synthase/HD superfamily hydrolase
MANFTNVPQLPNLPRALKFAAERHGRQIRKDGTPYIGHLLAVASLVIEAGGTEAETIAALLHDYVEDIDPEYGDVSIEDRFGEEVRDLVLFCTSTGKAQYREQIANAPDGAVLISAADSLHNMRGYAAGGARFDDAKAEHYKALAEIYRDCDRVPVAWWLDMDSLLLELGY